MVSLQAVDCPYCHKTSYFISVLNSGYCTNCGKIIYATSNEQVLTEVVNNDVPKPKTYNLTVCYAKRGYSYSRTMIVTITGPERKEFAINIDESIKVTLPEGEYQLIGRVHLNGGVNSSEIIGSKMIDLRRNTTVNVETGGLMNGRLIFN